jgi:hypothetical protein
MFFGLPEYHLARELARLLDRDRDTRSDKQHKAKSTRQTALISDIRRSRQPDACTPAVQPGRATVSNL